MYLTNSKLTEAIRDNTSVVASVNTHKSLELFRGQWDQFPRKLISCVMILERFLKREQRRRGDENVVKFGTGKFLLSITKVKQVVKV